MMDAREPIVVIRAKLARAKSAGQDVVRIDNLERLLCLIEESIVVADDDAMHTHERDLAHYQAVQQADLESYRSVIEAGREALNAASLINGGAVVALLSFLGSAVGETSSSALGLALTPPLLSFGLGVLSAALGHGARYLSQYEYDRNEARGSRFRTLTIILGVASYAGFGTGVIIAFNAFRAYFAGL